MNDKPTNISIKVFQQDWMPGFAAYIDDGEIDEGKAHVLLNISDFLATVNKGDVKASELPYLIAESLMHEVIHVLEAWANVEFSEERVEALINKYRQACGKGKADEVIE